MTVCFRDSTVHSFLCLYIFFGCWYNMEVKTICYVVQYAVHKELCSTNLFLDFLLFIGTFFSIKFYWRCQVESDNNISSQLTLKKHILPWYPISQSSAIYKEKQEKPCYLIYQTAHRWLKCKRNIRCGINGTEIKVSLNKHT